MAARTTSCDHGQRQIVSRSAPRKKRTTAARETKTAPRGRKAAFQGQQPVSGMQPHEATRIEEGEEGLGLGSRWECKDLLAGKVTNLVEVHRGLD